MDSRSAGDFNSLILGFYFSSRLNFDDMKKVLEYFNSLILGFYFSSVSSGWVSGS
ncbi:MAG: hypothetical protein ACTSWN_02975 [Promethearchaeota archaeon]